MSILGPLVLSMRPLLSTLGLSLAWALLYSFTVMTAGIFYDNGVYNWWYKTHTHTPVVTPVCVCVLHWSHLCEGQNVELKGVNSLTIPEWLYREKSDITPEIWRETERELTHSHTLYPKDSFVQVLGLQPSWPLSLCPAFSIIWSPACSLPPSWCPGSRFCPDFCPALDLM